MRLFFQRGHRTFTLANALTFLVAALHTSALAGDPPAEWTALYETMRTSTVTSGPFSASLFDVFAGVWIQVGALLAMFAAKNLFLLAVAAPEARRRAVHVLSLFDAICYALLTLLFLYYQIPPPLFSFAVLAALFLAAAFVSRRKGSESPA